MGGEDFNKNIRFEVGVRDSEALDRSMVWGFSTSIDFSECVWDCIQ